MKLDRSKFEQKSRPSQWLVSFRGPKEIERSSSSLSFVRSFNFD